MNKSYQAEDEALLAPSVNLEGRRMASSNRWFIGISLVLGFIVVAFISSNKISSPHFRTKTDMAAASIGQGGGNGGRGSGNGGGSGGNGGGGGGGPPPPPPPSVVTSQPFANTTPKPLAIPTQKPSAIPTRTPTEFGCPTGTKVAITTNILNSVITAIATHICTEGFGTLNTGTLTCQNGNNLALADVIGGILRLSFHDSATYSPDDGTGGPDGCIDFNNADNGGLKSIVYSKANAATLFTMDELYTMMSKFCSKADFWAIAANVAVKLGGGPDIAQRTGAACTNIPCVNFYWGRVDADAATCVTSDAGRLPSSQLAHQHILDVFQTRLGFTNQEIVALMGGHTVGHNVLEESHLGFTNAEAAAEVAANPTRPTPLSGRWDNTPHLFDNAYFAAITIPWRARTRNTLSDGVTTFSPSTFQWNIPAASTHVMLNTDMALVWDVSSVTLATVTAGSGACSLALGVGRGGGDLFNNCQENKLFSPYALAFANPTTGQTEFFKAWTTAWQKMQELGYSTTTGMKGAIFSITTTACV